MSHEHTCTECEHEFPCDRFVDEIAEDVWTCGIETPLLCPDCADFAMANAMINMGGSFASCIGRAWHAADKDNRAKLVEAFEDYAIQYRDLARLKRAKVAKG